MVSLRELIEIIERTLRTHVDVEFDAWRTGDQRYYVSDIARFGAATGWVPQTTVTHGIEALAAWLDAVVPDVCASQAATRMPVSVATGAQS